MYTEKLQIKMKRNIKINVSGINLSVCVRSSKQSGIRRFTVLHMYSNKMDP